MAGLVQGVGHVDSLSVALALVKLLFGVESVFYWTNELKSDLKILVEGFAFLDRGYDDDVVALFAHSMGAPNHHNVNVVFSFDLVLGKNDLDCSVAANIRQLVIDNANCSSGNLGFLGESLQSQLFQIRRMHNDFVCSALASFFLPNSFQLVSFVRLFYAFYLDIQHVDSAIHRRLSRKGFRNPRQPVDWIYEW